MMFFFNEIEKLSSSDAQVHTCMCTYFLPHTKQRRKEIRAQSFVFFLANTKQVTKLICGEPRTCVLLSILRSVHYFHLSFFLLLLTLMCTQRVQHVNSTCQKRPTIGVKETYCLSLSLSQRVQHVNSTHACCGM